MSAPHRTGHAEPHRAAVVDAVARALAEDLAPLGDLTSALVPPGLGVRGALVSRAAGVLAGTACVTETFAQLDERVVVEWHDADGDAVAPGQVLATVEGPLAPVLTGERTALNFLCHLSGVASATRRLVEAAAQGGAAMVWDTRKTLPGLRTLEKAAVRAGGGRNHRGNLSDWVMFKDNHLALLGVAEAVAAAREAWPGRLVHVEVGDPTELEAALDAAPDALLLDNFDPSAAAAAVAAVDAWVAAGSGRRRPLLECSGGITAESAAAFAATGVDAISTSAITQSAPALDIGLDLPA